ncbi:MAG: hypothetical protein HC912_02685 [Saprospiraceae bacterium]|nr:hypothetical protein [Saprospiraceae bacterium]
MEIINAENKEQPRYWLIALIVKVCNQYRNNNSVAETYNMLTAQVKTSKERVEADMEPVRYIIQAISMLGFLGTVIGLTDAISNSDAMLQIDPVAKENALKQIVNNFGMAFGTTLVALVLGLILTQRYHSYLRKMDSFFAGMESYIIDNLIIRIYNPKKEQ